MYDVMEVPSCSRPTTSDASPPSPSVVLEFETDLDAAQAIVNDHCARAHLQQQDGGNKPESRQPGPRLTGPEINDTARNELRLSENPDTRGPDLIADWSRSSERFAERQFFSLPNLSENAVLCDSCMRINLADLDAEETTLTFPSTGRETKVWGKKLAKHYHEMFEKAASCEMCTLILTLLPQAIEKRDDWTIWLSREPSGHILVRAESPYERRTGRLWICTDEDSELSSQILQRPKPLDPFCSANIKYIKQWISTCELDHQLCAHPDKPSVGTNAAIDQRPTRLLHIEEDSGGIGVRLVENEGPWRDYAAVSYCWGKDTILKTEVGNLNDHYTAIPWPKLQPRIQQAARLCLKLGFAHLWVDALCILQDDAQGWAREATKMDRIYSYASLTITLPASGTFPDDLTSEKFKIARTCHLRLANRDSHGQPIPNQHFYLCNEAYMDPPRSKLKLDKLFLWSFRGWTFQEQLLSRRMIIFQPAQLHLLCRTGPPQTEGCKDNKTPFYPWGTASDLSTFFLRSADLPLLTWLRLLSAYSHRTFTHYADRPYALLGLANRVAHAWSATYHAHTSFFSYPVGRALQPADQLSMFHQVLWCRVDVPLGFAKDAVPKGLPSWSWMAGPGSVSWQWLTRGGGAAFMGRYVPEFGVWLGRGARGPNRWYLLARMRRVYRQRQWYRKEGVVLPAEERSLVGRDVHLSKMKYRMWLADENNAEIGISALDCDIRECMGPDNVGMRAQNETWVVEIWSCDVRLKKGGMGKIRSGLLVQRVKGRPTFRRIGVAHIFDVDFFSELDTTMITLV